MLHPILLDVDQLLQEVTRRIASLEDGTFWDSPASDPADPTDPLSSDQAQALTNLFRRVDALFLNKEFPLAMQAYERLFQFFKLDWHITLPNLDERKAKAQYLRCMTEVLSGKERLSALLKSMLPEPDDLDWPEALQRPQLRDLLETLPDPIPFWDELLAELRETLSRSQNTCAKLLFLETLALTEGAAALEEFTRKHADREPLAFVCWIASEKSAGNWARMKHACLEGLEALPPAKELPSPYDFHPPLNIRWHFAHSLLQAGHALGDNPTLLQARWELFVEAPSDSSLRHLLLQAEAVQQWESQLKRACAFLHAETKLLPLTMKAELLRGQWEQAFALRGSRKAKTLGWSDPASAEGLFVASLLAALCRDKAPSTKVVRALLRRYADRPDPDYLCEAEDNAARQRPEGISSFYSDRILISAQHAPLPPERWEDSFRTVETLAERRIHAILEERMRGAYDRAAMLLAALVETRVCHEDHQAAQSLVRRFTKTRYSRLTTFRRALEPYLKEALVKGVSP